MTAGGDAGACLPHKPQGGPRLAEGVVMPPLCDRCLGRRLVGAAGNEAQQQAARAHRMSASAPAVSPPSCAVCEGAFDDASRWLSVALEALAGYQFRTLQVGSRFPAPCEQAERDAAAAMGMPLGESVRTEANRWLAAALAAATGAEPVTDGRPDVALLVDTRFWTAQVDPTSVLVRGRYTKHRRDLPQTHWPCKTCQGRGCHECDGLGVRYPSSVEDEIARILVPAFGATGASFHGAGREDIDALMLGTGRPFLLELHGPRRREADLGTLAAAIEARMPDTGVGVAGLAMASKQDVAMLKEADYDKAYLAHCELDAPVGQARLEEVAAALSGQVLQQRTPDRVSHRRADLVRPRRVHEVAVERCTGPTTFTLRVVAESGTYIKEFVSGDEGRTQPSVAGTLGVGCRVAELDVVGILDEGLS